MHACTAHFCLRCLISLSVQQRSVRRGDWGGSVGLRIDAFSSSDLFSFVTDPYQILGEFFVHTQTRSLSSSLYVSTSFLGLYRSISVCTAFLRVPVGGFFFQCSCVYRTFSGLLTPSPLLRSCLSFLFSPSICWHVHTPIDIVSLTMFRLCLLPCVSPSCISVRTSSFLSELTSAVTCWTFISTYQPPAKGSSLSPLLPLSDITYTSRGCVCLRVHTPQVPVACCFSFLFFHALPFNPRREGWLVSDEV